MKTCIPLWRATLFAAFCVLAFTASAALSTAEDSVALEPGSPPGVTAVHRAGTAMGYDEIKVTVRYHLESEELGVIYLWIFNGDFMEAVDIKGVEQTAPGGPGRTVIFTITFDPHEEVINEDEYLWGPGLFDEYDIAVTLEGFTSGLTLDGDCTTLTVVN